MTLRIFTTGGTFDKHYDAIAGSLTFDKTHLPGLLEQARISSDVSTQELMLIDSLDMNDSHRQTILEACRGATEDQLVIVHGTDTMAQTAAVLGTAGLAKTIVLTGAMVPAEVASSDAMFNLGYAIACAQQLGHGVWVAMNAAVHPWQTVRKNRAAGVFESLPPGGTTPAPR
jgi:L-asparaginase